MAKPPEDVMNMEAEEEEEIPEWKQPLKLSGIKDPVILKQILADNEAIYLEIRMMIREKERMAHPIIRKKEKRRTWDEKQWLEDAKGEVEEMEDDLDFMTERLQEIRDYAASKKIKLPPPPEPLPDECYYSDGEGLSEDELPRLIVVGGDDDTRRNCLRALPGICVADEHVKECELIGPFTSRHKLQEEEGQEAQPAPTKYY